MIWHERIPVVGNRRSYNRHNQGIRFIFGLSELQSLGDSSMKLIKLGTGKHAAIRAELSRKGIFPKQVSVLAERRKPSGVGKPDGLRHAATFKIGNLFWDDSKGYWRLSRTLSTHTRDANAWLVEQGVISLKEVWVSLYYPEGKASKHRLPR